MILNICLFIYLFYAFIYLHFSISLNAVIQGRYRNVPDIFQFLGLITVTDLEKQICDIFGLLIIPLSFIIPCPSFTRVPCPCV